MQGLTTRSTPSLLLLEKTEEGKPALCSNPTLIFSHWKGNFLQDNKARPSFAKNAVCFNDSCWDQEELRSRGLHLLVKTTDREEDGETYVGMQKESRKPKRFYQKAPHEEEEEKEEKDFSNRTSQEDILKVDTLVASLTACAKHKDLHGGSILHADIIRLGLFEGNVLVGSTLMNVYAKCGALEEAQDVLDELCVLDVVLWNALIAGCVQHGHGKKALDCFEEMRHEGLTPDAITLTCILKACGSIGAFDKGQEIHAQLAQDGLLEVDIVVGTALVDMYVKCGLLGRAQEVFDELLIRDVISWNVLITGYAHQGCFEEVLECFGRMQLEGFFPNKVTFICILKACGSMGALNKGQATHASIVKLGFLEKDIIIANALVDMYAKCSAFANALQVFGEHPNRDVVSWNAVIGGYAQHMHGKEAVKYFERMLEEGFPPDGVTFACVLKACGSIGVIDRGRELHADTVRAGLLEKDIVVANALVDMYAKCGQLAEAQEVFDELSVRDAVSWTALITGYVDHDCCEEALICFECMQHEGISIDEVTFVLVLKACGIIGDAKRGQHIHAEIVKEGLLERDVVVGTAIVDMYAKCGMLAAAQQVFNVLPVQNSTLWNALVNGYAQQLHGEEALQCFEQMQLKGFSPDSFTFVCVFKACGNIGATYKGLELHGIILIGGLLENCLYTGNSLVDMYASCGMVAEAQEVFDKLPVRDLVSWNALIQGYAQLGSNDFVFSVLERMIREDERPDMVTFTSLLNACSHRGLLNRGQLYFESMITNHGINPNLEHMICMVDLFGRAGHLDEAVAVIGKVPSADDIALWHSVLSACQKHGDIELGSWAFRHATHVNEKDSAAYVCMSDIHAAAGT